MRGPRKWIEKLAKWLPYHQDQYFLLLNNTIWGSYKPRFEPDIPDTEDPDAEKARALSALADFGRRSKTAIAAYQEHKSMGRA